MDAVNADSDWCSELHLPLASRLALAGRPTLPCFSGHLCFMGPVSQEFLCGE